MIRQNIFCSSTIEGHMYRRRAERKQASLIRLGMARIRARTAISFVLLVYAGRVLAQGAPASPEYVWHTSEERRIEADSRNLIDSRFIVDSAKTYSLAELIRTTRWFLL